MKLPNYNSEYNEQLFDACQKAAIQLTVRSGIIVQAIMRFVDGKSSWTVADDNVMEIVFQSMNQTFQNLKEVRRALRMKAFL